MMQAPGTRRSTAPQVAPIDWSLEARAALPVATWRSLMDRYYRGSTWIRLGREQRDALLRYRGEGACPSWDAAIDALLRDARATGVS